MSAPDARRRTVAVVMAGGTGQRMGAGVPKQLIAIAGKPIIEHTLTVLDTSEHIDDILVLMAPGYVGEVEKIVTAGGYRKVREIREGGATRAATTVAALAALGDTDRDVLLHDAVRPLVDHGTIGACVAALGRYEAVTVAVPATETMLVVDSQGEVVRDIPNRALLRRAQTPQGFRLATIREAYRLAAADPEFAHGESATDDCGVVLRYLPDIPIGVVPGSERNIKITDPDDVAVAETLLRRESRTAPPRGSPEGYQARLTGTTMVVFGGSYGIGRDIAELARGFGAHVLAFSRSATGTHVEDPEQVAAALQRAYAETGRIDYVVNTVSLPRGGKLADVDEATVAKIVAVNYLANVHIARAAVGYLGQTRGHLLLSTTSCHARGRAGYSLYSSTKAATVNLVQALADEWAPMGVRINCVNPEPTAPRPRGGAEPPETLVSSKAATLTSLDVLISELTGQVIDGCSRR